MANQIQKEQAGRYQPYLEYKDSGVEWLGKIPSHWDINKLKFVVNINMGQSPDSNQYSLDKLGIPFLQGNAEFGIKHPTPKLYCLYPKKIAEKGSILFSVRAPVGAQNIADQKYGIGRGLCSFTVNEKLLKSFLWWLLVDCKEQLLSKATGSTFEAVTVEQISNILFTYPPLQEQTQIAQFLDYETAKIDLLIEKQQKLIELLKEKRQAVISHAVTKGLDPNVEMKDSGVEWESKLPLGWEIKSVSHYFYAKKGSFASTLTKEYCESIKGNYPVFSGQTENNGILSYINTYEFNLEKGAILVTTVGAKAMTLKFIQGKFSLSQNCMIILSKNNCIDLRYIFYLFQVIFIYYRSLIPDHMQPSFRMEDFYSMKFFVPPLQEQTQIAEYLDTQTSKIDLLIEKAEAQITLMQERRTALISAAVTGKIDLRHWQMPEVSDHQGGDYE